MTSFIAKYTHATVEWLFNNPGPVLKLWLAGGSLVRRTLLRAYHTEDRIRSRIKIRIVGDGEGMIVYGAPGHSAVRAWVHIVNHNPFPIEIEHIVGYFKIGWSRITIPPCVRRTFDRHSDEVMYLDGELLNEHIEKIEAQLALPGEFEVGIEARQIVFNTEIRKVTVFRDLNTGNRRFSQFKNAEHRSRA